MLNVEGEQVYGKNYLQHYKITSSNKISSRLAEFWPLRMEERAAGVMGPVARG